MPVWHFCLEVEQAQHTYQLQNRALEFSQRLIAPGVPPFQGGTEDPCRSGPRVTMSSLAPLLLSHGTPNLSPTPVSSILAMPHSASSHHLDLKHPSPSHHPMSPGPLVLWLVFLPTISSPPCSHSIPIQARSFYSMLKTNYWGGWGLKPPPSGFPSEIWISQMTCRVLKVLHNPLSLPCNQPLTVPITLALPHGSPALRSTVCSLYQHAWNARVFLESSYSN